MLDFPELLNYTAEIVFIFDYYVFNFDIPMFEGQDEEREKVEKLALDPLFIIACTAKLIHNILKILFVICEMRGEQEVWRDLYLFR